MQPIPFKMKGTEYAITIKVATYPEGNLAIKLYQENFGQLIFWDTLTTNLGGLRPKDCGFVNTKTTGKRFYAWIKRNGLGEPTGQIRSESGVEHVEYLFNGKKLKKLDPDGYTYYSRRLKGELGRQYERLYLVLRRLANHVPHFHYTDYSGWRKLQDSDDTLPLWIEAEDPAHCLRYVFEHRGIILRTTLLTAIHRLYSTIFIAANKIWLPICFLFIKRNCLSTSPGQKSAANRVMKGMRIPLLKLSRKPQQLVSRCQRKRNLKKGGLDNETPTLPQGAVGSSLAQR